ncbi:MAG: TetR/AcrR family transcriptional regulator [Gemmatimonadota bacterium]
MTARKQKASAKRSPTPRRRDEEPDRPVRTELTHDDLLQAATRVDPELRRRSGLLWEDRSRSTRGPRAAFTPEEVVRAAVSLADEEGFGAVTMQAVSARLGFTTMAIYRYFPNKEALYDAIVDAGLGSPPRADDPSGPWRPAVTRWAHAKREMLCARPWLAELPFVAAPHGPNWLSWLEALAAPLSRTGLSAADLGQMISVIDGYTRGASDTSIALARSRARGVSVQAWAAAVGADLGRAIGDPRFTVFASILTAASEGTARSMTESFDFGLQRVLDGVELYMTAGSE